MLSCGLRRRILFSLLCSLPLIILIVHMMAHGEVHPIPRARLHQIQPFHHVRISMCQGAAVSRLLLCIALPWLALWVPHVKVPYAWSFLQLLMAALHLVAALLQVLVAALFQPLVAALMAGLYRERVQVLQIVTLVGVAGVAGCRCICSNCHKCCKLHTVAICGQRRIVHHTHH